MASEEDNFDIDIYGDGGEDYGLDGVQDDIKVDDNTKVEETTDQVSEPTENPSNPSVNPPVDGHQGKPESKQENEHSQSDVAQKIISTDPSAPDSVQLPKQAPQIQGLKRKDGADDRHIDPGATSALFVSELNWWINDDDIRGWANQSQCEDELEEITFSEHKVNGKSKGQAYVLFKSQQAATATKQKIESFGEGQYSTRKFVVSYTNPYTNPFKTLPKDGPMRNTPASNNRSTSGAYGSSGTGGQHTGYNSYRSNRGGGYNNRGVGMSTMSGFTRGGFPHSMASGFQSSGISGYQGGPMGAMQPYGGFQGRGAIVGGVRGGQFGIRGGRAGMNPSGMMSMPMNSLAIGGLGSMNMNMNMPQMSGGMVMQGMQGSHSPHVHPTPLHSSSTVPPNRYRSLVPQEEQHIRTGPIGASSPGVPIGLGAGASNKPSSAWASYTQYSTSPLDPARFPSQSSPPTAMPPFQPQESLNRSSYMTGNQAHFNPAFFPQGQQNVGAGDASWNPHGAKRTRQE